MENVINKIKETANKAKEKLKNLSTVDILKTAGGVLGIIGAIAVIKAGAELPVYEVSEIHPIEEMVETEESE